MDKLTKCLDELVERHYQLRLEHNHGDMKWYAYYSTRYQRNLFDKEIDWRTGSDTPLGAVEELLKIVKEEDVHNS